MPLGDELTDKLAYELVQTDFDAVERDGYRAAWTEEGTHVEVTNLETDETHVYNGEDLVRAESDREISNARQPG